MRARLGYYEKEAQTSAGADRARPALQALQLPRPVLLHAPRSGVRPWAREETVMPLVQGRRITIISRAEYELLLVWCRPADAKGGG
jgi:hypothetical protein